MGGASACTPGGGAEGDRRTFPREDLQTGHTIRGRTVVKVAGFRERLRDFVALTVISLGLTAAWLGIIGHFVSGKSWSWPWATLHTERLVRSRWSEIVQGPRLGRSPQAGSVAIVEFADYECPACREAFQVVSETLSPNEQGRIVYRNLPLESIHPLARDAALASICAQRQGRFGEMHDALFERNDWSSEPDWSQEARLSGVEDIRSFINCMGSQKAAEQLAQDSSLSVVLGLHATPSFVTRSGKIIMGVPSRAELLTLLGHEGG